MTPLPLPIPRLPQWATQGFAALTVCVVLPLAFLFSFIPAFAGNTTTLEVGHKISYGATYTNWFTCDGAPAFCGNPSKATPPSGTYEKAPIVAPSGRTDETVADLWYGYGGPGFDPSMWPSTWYDGSPMDNDKYIAATHVLLSDTYTSDGNYAMKGCSQEVKNWFIRNILGFDYDGTIYQDAAGRKIFRAMCEGKVPSSFQAFQASTGPTTQFILSFVLAGNLEFAKGSTDASLTDGNGCYALPGAEYTLFRDQACTDAVGSIVADQAGTGRLEGLAPGTYYLKETKAPTGFALDEAVRPVTIAGGATAHVEARDVPQSHPPKLLVAKVDGETGQGTPQGDASLAGAEYTVRYYDGYYDTAAAAEASGAPKRTWVFRSDADGSVPFDDAHRVSGDALYHDSAGRPAFPLGTILVHESKAPTGYLLDSTTVFVAKITADGATGETVGAYEAPAHEEQVVRGGVAIEKRDLESELLTPLGGASLDSTVFQITNRSARAVMVDGALHEPGQVCKTIRPVGGVASTAANALPYGSYDIQETAPGTGYLHTDTRVRPFQIRQEGVIVRFGEAEGQAAYNQVKRGDVEFVKVRETDQHRLAGVPFLIESATTGEAHVIVTDENGEAKTASEWNPHSQNTNGNDAAVGEDGTVDEARLDPTAGLWFGLTTEGWTVEVQDDLGALPYDTYFVRELPCSANAGVELVSILLNVRRDGYQVDLGSVDDQPAGQVSIATTARDGADGDHEVSADAQARVVDRVAYAGVTVGSAYRMEGTLMAKGTGEAVTAGDGTPVTATAEFEAKATNGYVELEFAFDARPLAGSDVVCFERLVDVGADAVVAEHADLDDWDQTVSLPGARIGTTATDAASGTHTLAAATDARIVDAIAYQGLVPGVEYQALGSLMRVSPEGTAEPLLDRDGSPVTATAAFIPGAEHGTVEVAFAFDGSELGGAKLVAFEKIMREGEVVAAHEDPGDSGQTVDVGTPLVTSLATNAANGTKEVQADSEARVTDAIAYDHAVEGRAYHAYGMLMDAATGLPLLAYAPEAEEVPQEMLEGFAAELSEVLGIPPETTHPVPFDAEGVRALLADERYRPVTSRLVTTDTAFVAEATGGSMELDYRFDARELSGEAVSFTALVDEESGAIVASESETPCPAQTVSLLESSIGTMAYDGADGDGVIARAPGARVMDEVAYESLVPGKAYTIQGVLMDKATGEPLVIDGELVTATKDFTPNTPSGTIGVEFSFDASTLADQAQLVAFERLYRTMDADGDTEYVEVASHEDIDAKSQTVTVGSPPPTTGAKLAQTGDHSPWALATLAVLCAGGLALIGRRTAQQRRQRRRARRLLDGLDGR